MVGVVTVGGARLAPGAVVSLGEWESFDTGERVEPACVVMRRPARVPDGRLEVLRPELPVELR